MKLRILVLLLVLVAPAVRAADPTEAELRAQYERIAGNAPSGKHGLTAPERKRLFRDASDQPIARLSAIGRFDPQGIIGFCFGRAMTVHLLARKMGLEAAGIRKLFILGDLRSGPNPEWRFHVTTLVKGTDGQEYAVDPIMTAPIAPGGPLLRQEWIRIVKGVWDRENKAKLYATDAHIVFPDITVDADATTGGHVIELEFDPDAKDFRSTRFGQYKVYEPSPAQQIDYFLGNLAEEGKRGSFRFLGIDITGMGEVSYNGYFVELLRSLESPLPAIPAGVFPHSEARTVRPLAVEGNPAKNLYSPRFFGRKK